MIDRVVVMSDDSLMRGGAARVVLRQVSLLADRGVPVTFVAGDAGIAPELGRRGVERVAIGAGRLRDLPKSEAAVRGVWHRRAGRAVASLIARTDTPGTVYHLHNWQTILSPATLAALRPVASRTWLHAHDYFLCCPNGAFFDYVADRACPLVPLSGRCALADCDKVSRAEKAWRLVRQATLVQAMGNRGDLGGVMLVHESMAEPFERSGWPADRLHVVANPLPPGSIRRIPAETNDTLLFVGRLEREKGIEALLEAGRAAGERIEVAGDGTLRDSLAARHPEARLRGWLGGAELRRTLAGARFLIMPTLLREPCGLVILEALQAGVPVVVSRSAGLAADIADAGAGILCDPQRPERLTEQLRAVRSLRHDEVRRMSLAARRLAGRLAPTEARWIDAMLELYAGVVLDPRPA